MRQRLVQVALFVGLSVAIPNGNVQKRDLVVADKSTLPQGWSSYGCYFDAADRTLNGAVYKDPAGMTDESCVQYCAGQGYAFAGTEYTDECYCGNYFAMNQTQPMTDCNMPCAGNATEACGGPYLLNVFYSGQALPSTNPGPAGWNLLGCYAEGTTGRALTTLMPLTGGNAANTVELCLATCKAAGFIYAGVEYSYQCFCGNTISNGGGPAPNGISDCNMPCTGNSSEFCGAGERLDMYEQVGGPSTELQHVPSVGAYTWQGCYTDAITSRALTANTLVNYGTMTVEICAAFCAGYTYFGVEYAGECYCGNVLAGGSVLSTTTSCNMLCDGNQLEYCGGPNRLDFYSSKGTHTSASGSTPSATVTPTGPQHVASVGAYTWQGCYTDVVGARTLTGNTLINYNTMTVEICAGYCAGYSYFGVEYSGECYCGNVLENGGAPSTTASCNMLCDGNQLEYCGGPNRLDFYSSKGTPTSPAGTTPTSAVTGPVLPTGWSYSGCYVDNVDARILGYEFEDNNGLTIEFCVNECIAAGYTIAGMEWSVQCFCDDFIVNSGALSADQSDCNMPCGGNANEMCGAGNRMSIYNTGTIKTVAAPAVQVSGLPGSWTYSGCITDNVNDRTLPWQIISLDNNTAANCLSQCSAFGYNAGGLEFSHECYCGDISYVEAGTSTVVADTECAQTCSGNASEICGGPSLLSYYTWTGPPLYTWHTPTGPDMGAYEFLIGGVVVPLLTTVGVNGKVTFLEKWGTSEAPNSTGAYELDLAEINNFSAAWRTMHVQTDVFCSASLTLPDRVGRQINIGGWSGVSNFGVRLYWPDGSPGVPGTNDWQENHNEVALLNARWYASAMIMANGSILVVGGEQGAGAAPSPTIELLPATGGGTVYLDFLAKTDPNNLYPFVCAIPSGIFIVYVNNARILDPVTFDTIAILPTLPGNVNNPGAGRSYPEEGTGVILPQHAPYTDPVTILICGGSTQDGQAMDNCVSTQPEVANPTWTIERMPSKRVMSCIANLPDGTFLIANGAQQGIAGFAVSSNPNLVAVLYDPSKPVGFRMSIMATTIVARLYHSEAILLQDGRVLISGSDPEDGVHPEEYRVEVFVPPYLLNGATQPTLNCADKDWSYNGTYSVTISLPTGNVAGAKFSLVSAVSSTHGNSMGMRTLFPAFSCSGNTCTITAPPTSAVCPPGWFQLFLLDGPTPSYSVWVRIGGDPAELGNWPNFPDFDLPGMGPIGPSY